MRILSHQLIEISKQSETNLTELDGIVRELTEICTAAKGWTENNKKELGIRREENIVKSRATKEELETKIGERKKLHREIEKSSQELANVAMDLPGVITLLLASASDKCHSAAFVMSRFLRNISQHALDLKFLDLRTVKGELGGLREKLKKRGDEGDDNTILEYEEMGDRIEDSLSKEKAIHANFSAIKILMLLLLDMLKKGDMNEQMKYLGDLTLETQEKLKIEIRSLNMKPQDTPLERILCSLTQACEAQQEHWQTQIMNSGTHIQFQQQVLTVFMKAKKSIDTMLTSSLKSKSDIILQVHVLDIQTTVNEEIQKLRKGRKLDEDNCMEILRRTRNQMPTTMKKVRENLATFKQIISTVFESCQTLLDESRSWRVSKPKIEEVKRNLEEELQLLNRVLQEMEENINAKKAKLKELQKEITLQLCSNGKRSTKRNIEGNKLHTLNKKYDQKTDEIVSHFEVQKEMAEVLSKFTSELAHIDETLNVIEGVFGDLSKVSFKVTLAGKGTDA